MKLQAMEVGKKYIVVQGEDTETLQTGDHIQQLDDGSLLCQEAEGWLAPGEWEDLDVEVEIDKDYYVKQQRKILESLEQIDKILGDS